MIPTRPRGNQECSTEARGDGAWGRGSAAGCATGRREGAGGGQVSEHPAFHLAAAATNVLRNQLPISPHLPTCPPGGQCAAEPPGCGGGCGLPRPRRAVRPGTASPGLMSPGARSSPPRAWRRVEQGGCLWICVWFGCACLWLCAVPLPHARARLAPPCHLDPPYRVEAST